MQLEPLLEDLEKRYLLKALDKSGGAKKKAADLLGMSFRSFRYRLAKFGLDSGDE
jgi:two-component system response regulator PilR (NtrC family)